VETSETKRHNAKREKGRSVGGAPGGGKRVQKVGPQVRYGKSIQLSATDAKFWTKGLWWDGEIKRKIPRIRLCGVEGAVGGRTQMLFSMKAIKYRANCLPLSRRIQGRAPKLCYSGSRIGRGCHTAVNSRTSTGKKKGRGATLGETKRKGGVQTAGRGRGNAHSDQEIGKIAQRGLRRKENNKEKRVLKLGRHKSEEVCTGLSAPNRRASSV